MGNKAHRAAALAPGVTGIEGLVRWIRIRRIIPLIYYICTCLCMVRHLRGMHIIQSID